MSQIEHKIRVFLGKHPEIEKCTSAGLVNRRSLARCLIKNGVATSHQLEAVIAALRRFDFKKYKKEELDLFKKIRVRVKDDIIILDFEKEKKLMQELKKIINSANYDKEETLKIVVGSSSIKIFVDDIKKEPIKELIKDFKLNHKHKNISEISIIFPEEAISTKGIISFLTRELYLNDILINELLTASPELIIYLKEEYTIKAYEIIKSLMKN